MTKRAHRRGLLEPRKPRIVKHYGPEPHPGWNDGQVLTDTEAELEQRRRVDDKRNHPLKSEALRALLILIEGAERSSGPVEPLDDKDLRGYCEDAKLTDRQTEVMLMIGEGWGISNIAFMLGITRQTVEQHIRYGRCKLVRQAPPIGLVS